MGSEINYALIAGRRSIHRIVMDVGILKGMGMVWADHAQVHVSMSGMALGKVVVQHRSEGCYQQQGNRQQ